MDSSNSESGFVELLKALNIPRYYMRSYLTSEERCPHCATNMPTLELLWRSDLLQRGTAGPRHKWATYRCTRCGGVTLAKGVADESNDEPGIVEVFPKNEQAHEDIPEPARTFLQEAVDTLGSPNASTVMSGSAVDAMLKELGLEEGSVYMRINEAVKRHVITASMGEWAHSVRLEANRPRHADKKAPTVSLEEAKQAVEFAKALAYFLFVLTSRVARGTEAAKNAAAAAAAEPPTA